MPLSNTVNKKTYLHNVNNNILLLLFALSPFASPAQELDSLRHSPNIVHRVDSLSQQIQSLPDSVSSVYSDADSILNDFNTRADSLQDQYHKTISDINARMSNVNRTIDSLRELKLPIRKHERTLKKLSALKTKTEAGFSGKLNTLKSGATEKLAALDLPDEYNEPLLKLTSQIDRVSLDGNFRVPELEIPGYHIPEVGGLDELPVGAIGNRAAMPQLPDAKTPSQLTEVSQQAQSYQQGISDIASGDIANPQKLQETIESQASHIEGLEELKQQSGVIDQHKTQLDNLADPKNAKEKLLK